MELWKSELLDLTSDITIYVDGKKYDLHRIVLYISPVLKTQFEGNYRERQEMNKIIENIEIETWENCLNYIYDSLIKGFISNYTESEYKGFRLEILNTKEKINLIELADMYLINNLKDNLSKLLSKEIWELFGNQGYEEVEFILKYKYYSEKILKYDYNNCFIFDIENTIWISPNIDIISKYPHLLYLILTSISANNNERILVVEKHTYNNIKVRYRDEINRYYSIDTAKMYDKDSYDVSLIQNNNFLFRFTPSLNIIKSLKLSYIKLNNEHELYSSCISKILEITLEKYPSIVDILLSINFRLPNDNILYNTLLKYKN